MFAPHPGCADRGDPVTRHASQPCGARISWSRPRLASVAGRKACRSCGAFHEGVRRPCFMGQLCCPDWPQDRAAVLGRDTGSGGILMLPTRGGAGRHLVQSSGHSGPQGYANHGRLFSPNLSAALALSDQCRLDQQSGCLEDNQPAVCPGSKHHNGLGPLCFPTGAGPCRRRQRSGATVQPRPCNRQQAVPPPEPLCHSANPSRRGSTLEDALDGADNCHSPSWPTASMIFAGPVGFAQDKDGPDCPQTVRPPQGRSRGHADRTHPGLPKPLSAGHLAA